MHNYDAPVNILTKLLTDEAQNGLKIARTLQMYLKNTTEPSFEKTIESNIPKGKENTTGFKPIGTWHPVCQNHEIIFMRQTQADSIFWESTRTEIKQKKVPNTKRVCVIGESAASGMFFTPQFSPTIALDSYLIQYSDHIWETIDLTRSCMNVGALFDTCHAALQLEPDFLVIIAGNNWFSDVIFEHDAPFSKRQTHIKILEQEGPQGLTHAYRKDLKAHAKNIKGQLEEISRITSSVFIVAVPASNYADWERRVPISWLTNHKTSKWYELYQEASAALERKSYEESLELGHKMIAIDGGFAPTSNRIVANSLMALERHDEAHSFCVTESDYAIMYDQITSFPGTPSFVRKILMNSKDNANLFFIDLETVFIDYLNKKTIGSTLFIDYCHMTPTAFNVAMAPIASLILNSHDVSFSSAAINEKNTLMTSDKRQERPSSYFWKDLVQKLQTPIIDSFRLAISYFYIALYNCHFNEPVINTPEIADYVKLFQKAVDCNPSILHAMELYIQARGCEFGAGFSLSKAGQSLYELINSPLDFPVAQSTPGVDALTINALCETLQQNGRNGYELRDKYQAPYIRLLEKGVDLTEPLYIERINSVVRLAVDSEISTRRKVPFYKSWWPFSHFSLVADTKSDLELKLVCRRSSNISHNTDRKLEIIINGNVFSNIPITEKWCKHTLIICKNQLINGFNRLSIKWPQLEQIDAIEIQKIATRYAMGLNIDVFPVFGEVHSLMVRKIRNKE